MNSDETYQHYTLLVKATSISGFCCISMCTTSHDRCLDVMLKQWISSQIWLDIISLQWLDIQHNWLEMVCCPAVILSSAAW